MKHLFINYELALTAKEKGFNTSCFAFKEVTNETYHIISKTHTDYMKYGFITYQQLIDWFREKHNITIEPFSILKGVRKATFKTVYRVQLWGKPKGYRDFNKNTLNKALEKAFKLI